MPIEVTLLDGKRSLDECPACGDRPFRPFLRGQVQRSSRTWFGFGKRRPYVALICWSCKKLVAYEDPKRPVEIIKKYRPARGDEI